MNVFNLDGLYNPKDIGSKTIKTGKLSNLLGNNIALLKVIGVKTEYTDSRLYSNDRKKLREVFNELNGMGNDEYIGNGIDPNDLEADTTIYIKVTKLTGAGYDIPYYLKLNEITPITYGKDEYWSDYSDYERIINLNKSKLGLKINSRAKSKEYYVIKNSIGLDKTPYNRFKYLLDMEFLVTGLGVPIDERFNSLDGLIILDGVLSDYRK